MLSCFVIASADEREKVFYRCVGTLTVHWLVHSEELSSFGGWGPCPSNRRLYFNGRLLGLADDLTIEVAQVHTKCAGALRLLRQRYVKHLLDQHVVVHIILSC